MPLHPITEIIISQQKQKVNPAGINPLPFTNNSTVISTTTRREDI
jgi:hypothetical protein